MIFILLNFSNIFFCKIGASKRKEYAESIPKPKKKLAIIDPCTGKDILESVADDESKQDHVSHCNRYLICTRKVP